MVINGPSGLKVFALDNKVHNCQCQIKSPSRVCTCFLALDSSILTLSDLICKLSAFSRAVKSSIYFPSKRYRLFSLSSVKIPSIRLNRSASNTTSSADVLSGLVFSINQDSSSKDSTHSLPIRLRNDIALCLTAVII